MPDPVKTYMQLLEIYLKNNPVDQPEFDELF